MHAGAVPGCLESSFDVFRKPARQPWHLSRPSAVDSWRSGQRTRTAGSATQRRSAGEQDAAHNAAGSTRRDVLSAGAAVGAAAVLPPSVAQSVWAQPPSGATPTWNDVGAEHQLDMPLDQFLFRFVIERQDVPVSSMVSATGNHMNLVALIINATTGRHADGADSWRKLEDRVSEFTLPNGLHFIVLERHTAPVLACHTYANVGAFDEEDGKTGGSRLGGGAIELKRVIAP